MNELFRSDRNVMAGRIYISHGGQRMYSESELDTGEGDDATDKQLQRNWKA